ncbi:hypothetical protein TWF106_006340 [Orbilia oligospora]|uniref:PD-(D/E)XK nuclease-like domain-containing protein n=1 Tax=Orbilia oligospora TaxID=2813651 RepID=A0A7C8R200_ORBOL|nr:hypothetical protein TWF106_006340 [Orbilia oligospora]
MAYRRSEMAACVPPFIFGHQNRRASKTIPPDVAGFGIRASPERLIQGSLAISMKTVAGTEYPVEYFAPSLFATESPYHENLLEHVKHQGVLGNRNFNKDTDEGGWPSQVTRGLPTEFANTCERSLFPPSEVDKTLSPTAHRTSQFSPAFCVIEVKAEGGDFQEAQTQAAVVGASILLKARQIGASPDVVPCVPAIVTIGHIWHLNLIYEEKKGIVVAGPWIIGNTLTFLGTLRVVLYTLFVKELRRYAIDTRGPNFVDESCRELLERRLEG